jgi:2-methylcitrate dehydratase PrpD
VHAGAVVVPAVLAACEKHNPDGRMALIGIAVGTEVLCRLSLVVPKAVHKAGFHPTAVFGAMGAAAGVGAALGLNAKQVVDALGIAGSMAGGIIEYLAEGAWTKRLHAGWAAQSGIRAALLARQGFVGPRTVFEGVHGLFHGFAHTSEGDYDALIGDFGMRWVTDTLAFKPYPCGTMAQPYIDCARRLAAWGVKPEDIGEIVCTGCGSRSPTSSVRATAMPPSSRCRICWRLVSSMAASASARSRKLRSATATCSRSPPR